MLINLFEFYDNCYKNKMNLNKINRNCEKYKNNRKHYLDRIFALSCTFSENMNHNFIKTVIYGRRNKIMVYVIDNNIYGLLVYRKAMNNRDRKRYVIFLLSVKKEYRKAGIGSNMMNAFKDKINQSYSKKRIEIVLHSLESSAGFYKKYGFHEINTNKFIERYEGYMDDYSNSSSGKTKNLYIYRLIVNQYPHL